MTASLLAKLTAKGIPLDGPFGGLPSMTPQQIAGCLAGCEHPAFLAVMTKYTGDPQSEHELTGLLGSMILARMIRHHWKHPEGPFIGSRKIAAMLVEQYLKRDRMSLRQRADKSGINRECYRTRWKLRIEPLEDELNVWETQGIAYLTDRWHRE